MDEKYDDVDWHWGDNWPQDTPLDNAYVHLAALMYWAILRNRLDAAMHMDDPNDLKCINDVLSRKTTPLTFVVECCDGSLVRDDFTDETNDFLSEYYDDYLDDFVALFGRDDYGVPDEWSTYDRVVPMLDERYEQWEKGETLP